MHLQQVDTLGNEQNKLEDSLKRLKRAQRIAHFGNWEQDMQTGIVNWSDETCRIYGVPETENQQTFESWQSFLHPDERTSVVAIVQDAIKNKEALHFRHRIVRRDGTERDAESHLAFDFNDDDQVAGMYGVAHDITEIIATKKDLARTADNLQLILDLIPLSIYARQANGDYIFGNHVFLKHYGLKSEDLRGKNLKDFVRSEAELLELASQDKLVLSSGKKLIVSEFRQVNHAGNPTYWRIIKIPFAPRGQEVKAILGIAEDITQTKKREEDLLQLSESISARNNELERFSFMVSHELRGPLSTIMGVSELIDHVRLSQDDLAAFIYGIRNSINKLDDVIRVLNDLTVAPYYAQKNTSK
jgi:PAS domain S-box-containing protein